MNNYSGSSRWDRNFEAVISKNDAKGYELTGSKKATKYKITEVVNGTHVSDANSQTALVLNQWRNCNNAGERRMWLSPTTAHTGPVTFKYMLRHQLADGTNIDSVETTEPNHTKTTPATSAPNVDRLCYSDTCYYHIENNQYSDADGDTLKGLQIVEDQQAMLIQISIVTEPENA